MQEFLKYRAKHGLTTKKTPTVGIRVVLTRRKALCEKSLTPSFKELKLFL
jgi:hypothetical protein